MKKYDHKDVNSDGHQWLNEFSHPLGWEQDLKGLREQCAC